MMVLKKHLFLLHYFFYFQIHKSQHFQKFPLQFLVLMFVLGMTFIRKAVFFVATKFEVSELWRNCRLQILKASLGFRGKWPTLIPRGNDRLPTIHFQGRTVSFREGTPLKKTKHSPPQTKNIDTERKEEIIMSKRVKQVDDMFVLGMNEVLSCVSWNSRCWGVPSLLRGWLSAGHQAKHPGKIKHWTI